MLHPNFFKKTISAGNGADLIIETGKLAKQANGAVVVRQGKTMILATVVSPEASRESIDYLPLTVEYQEKYAATGRFPGGFNKREARLSNYEILISRIVDRTLRPLFPDNYHSEIQVIINLISAEEDVMPDSLVGLAASTAICISDIPFGGPISIVRVGKIDNQLKINPGVEELKRASLSIIVAGTLKDLNMVEGEMKEVSEEEMVEALKFAHDAIKIQCNAQLEIMNEIGKPKREFVQPEEDEELKSKLADLFKPAILEIVKSFLSKHERSEAFSKILKDYLEALTEEELEKTPFIKRYYHDFKKEVIRTFMLDEKLRLDKRKFNEIREIEIEVDYLPMAHGSALFTRGETQSLTSVTLGNKLAEQLVDGAMFQRYDRFMLHYNFPPFSTGEAKPMRGPGRREIGHGNLAQRALEQVLPNEFENPYTVRIVSDILESNGSSSMATVCAGALSLMDAGIKIKRPVSGIAMGLIVDENHRYAILSDILGDEDHIGDMDFKVCGTVNGITACQMDIKVDGLSNEILTEALLQAREGRLHILSKMSEVLAEPRTDYKPHAPRIEKLVVDNEFIGAIIGTGGKVIQQLQKDTGAVIVIEEAENGDGIVEISAKNGESMAKAIAAIKLITTKPEVGKVYNGKVKSLVDFGAFVEYLPGQDGLLHVSEYSWERQQSLSDVLKVGEMVEVKLVEYDKRSNKSRLSRKALLPRPENTQSRPPRQENRE